MAPKDKELYETLFKDLSPVEYLKITKIANWKTFKSGETIIRQEHLVTDLVLIYNGTVNVVVGKKKVAELKEWVDKNSNSDNFNDEFFEKRLELGEWIGEEDFEEYKKTQNSKLQKQMLLFANTGNTVH